MIRKKSIPALLPLYKLIKTFGFGGFLVFLVTYHIILRSFVQNAAIYKINTAIGISIHATAG